MKNTVIKNLMLLLIISGLGGCKEVNCPAFPEYLVDYYPYSESSLIEFVNSTNDTLKLTVLTVYKSESYTKKWNEKSFCGANAGFKTETNDYYSLKIDGRIITTDYETSIIKCTFSDENISNDLFGYSVEDIDPFNKENANLFGDTISIKKDEYYRFNDIVIVRKEGLVSFWDETFNCFWTKIE
ncbi:MAG: hypothetical protein U9N53_00810 [Bacteroidota bacterium]|nr:hypothetical protein [Bacteroidota bacterium]